MTATHPVRKSLFGNASAVAGVNAPGTVVRIRVADLHQPPDPRVQIRFKVTDDKIDEYAETMRLKQEQGKDPAEVFGPIVLFRGPDGELLADGFHRVAAAPKAGQEWLRADIRTGGLSEALEYALQHANQGHGLQYSREDRHNGVKKALEQWGHTRSDRLIAEMVGVNQSTVTRIRQTWEREKTGSRGDATHQAAQGELLPGLGAVEPTREGWKEGRDGKLHPPARRKQEPGLSLPLPEPEREDRVLVALDWQAWNHLPQPKRDRLTQGPYPEAPWDLAWSQQGAFAVALARSEAAAQLRRMAPPLGLHLLHAELPATLPAGQVPELACNALDPGVPAKRGRRCVRPPRHKGASHFFKDLGAGRLALVEPVNVEAPAPAPQPVPADAEQSIVPEDRVLRHYWHLVAPGPSFARWCKELDRLADLVEKGHKEVTYNGRTGPINLALAVHFEKIPLPAGEE